MKKITNIESKSMQYLLSFPLFMGLGLSKIIKTSAQDAWLSIILGTIFGLIINYLLTKLPQKNNKFFELIHSFLLFYLGVVLITKLVSSIYLTNTPNFLVMLPGLILLYYTTTKDINTLYRVTSILLIFNLILFFIAVLALIPTIKIDYFLPLITTSSSNILLSALDFALISTLPLTLMPNFKEQYDYKIYITSSFSILLIFLCTLGNLGVEISQIYRYPEYMVFKRISILNFMENIENILFIMWIANIYSLTGLSSIKINNIIGKRFFIPLLIIVLIISDLFILDNYIVKIKMLEYYTFIIGGIYLLFLLSKLIKKKHKY